MPRPFPSPSDLEPERPGLLARLRRWWRALFAPDPAQDKDRAGEPLALPQPADPSRPADPIRPDPIRPAGPTIAAPAILPEPASADNASQQWLGFLRGRGAAPPSPMLEEVRSHLLAEVLTETQSAQQSGHKGDMDFLQRLAKVLVTSDLQLPPFPSIARELDNLLFRGDPSAMDVTAVVERDPALVREIWVRASSAHFRRAPTRLDEAVARLGFTELWRIAMQMAMQSPVFRAGTFQQEAEHIHEHGVLCAEIASQLAREPRGVAYISGLLHDVGKLVIYRAAGFGKEPPSQTIVGRMIQNHHSAIGMLAARSWNLGPDVEFAIGFHHHPPLAMLGRPGPLGPTAIAEAAIHIASSERGGKAPADPRKDGEPHGLVFGELPEEVREAVLAAHRLLDLREGKRGGRGR